MKKEIKAKAKPKVLLMVRINTRIRPGQRKYIKAIAKKNKLTEGEVFRSIIDAHMSVNK
jgi:hypothetical protein